MHNITVVFALAASLAVASSNAEVSSMACHTLDRKQVDEERIRFEAKPLYVPGDQGRGTVVFRFNLKPVEIGDALFLIISGRLQKAVYRGPYQANIRIEIDEALSRDKHYDGLEFRLLRTEQRQFCTWINEQSEPYWRAGAQVDIDFLEAETVDMDGLPKRFQVKMRLYQ